MKIITRYDYAQTAPARWIATYENTGLGKSWQHVTDKMKVLQPPFNPDEIDAIIGNSSWTHIASCGECEKEAEAIMELGQEPDYESATAYLCLPCLGKAFALAASASA
jgi:hypothetical protein